MTFVGRTSDVFGVRAAARLISYFVAERGDPICGVSKSSDRSELAMATSTPSTWPSSGLWACMLRAANGFPSSGFIERAGVADSRSEISGLAPAMVVWTPASQLELA